MIDTWQPSPEQQEILHLNAGRHLVLAPPGTGKTELLAWRVRDALRAGIPPERILCLTFTVRAAEAMKERIRAFVPTDCLPELGNFHHWCYQFLLNRRLVPGNWQVVDEILQAELMGETVDAVAAESQAFAKEIDSMRDRTGQLPIDALIAHAVYIRQQALDFPKDVLREPNTLGAVSPQLLHRIAKSYRKRKEDLHLLDFNDLLLYAYLFVAIKQAIPDSEKCSWVQIDEVQDLNPLQWGLVRALSAPHAHQVFFGDGEQSIFSFLGSSSPHLARMAATCDGIHSLARNYRSRSYLLDLTVRYAIKTLHADWDTLPMPGTIAPPAPDSLRLAEVSRGISHEDWLAHSLDVEFKSLSRAFPRTAILVRTNRRADDFETALKTAGLPVCKVSGTDWSSRPEARDFKAFLSVLVHPSDRMAWARLFRLFAGIPSHPHARRWISDLFDTGLRPGDLLESDSPTTDSTPLDTMRLAVAAPPPARVIVFDTETTGRDPLHDDIIQLAALELINGRPGRTFERFFLSERDLSESENIHHISRTFLDTHGVPPAGGLRDFIDFVGNAPLAGHNVSFDRDFLAAALRRHGLPPIPATTLFIDTLDASRRLFPHLKSFKLANLIDSFQLAGVNSHNAADDVAATAQLLLRLVEEADGGAHARHAFLHDNAAAISRFRESFLPLWTAFTAHPDRHGDFRHAWSAFLDAALAAAAAAGNDALDSRDEMDRAAAPFLRYANHTWGNACQTQPFLEILRREHRFLTRCKEVDFLVGDEPIVVSTVHKAKGLEFPRVIIPDAQDGVYPHTCDRDDEACLESARLLYVAMTRAQTRLWILYSDAPSPFLAPVLECFHRHRPDLYARLLGMGRGSSERPFRSSLQFSSTTIDADWLARYGLLASAIHSRTPLPGLPVFLSDSDPVVRALAIKLQTLLASRPDGC